jgi:hypothetical protein
VDFFSDPDPEADLRFYGMIFHDWLLEVTIGPPPVSKGLFDGCERAAAEFI